LKRRISHFLFAACFFLAGNSFADNGRWRHITTDDGLAQNSVFGIVQDHQGFMWFGTQDGLCRYDGNHYLTFRPDLNDSNSINSNYIRGLLVGRDGNLWIVTRNGLNRYDPVKGIFSRPPVKEVPAVSFLGLAEDSSGNIWVCTNKDGVYCYNPETKKAAHYLHDDKNPNSICGNNIRGITCDKSGHLWFMSWSNGMSEFDPVKKNWTTFSMTEGPGKLCYPTSRGALFADSKGRIWIGTWGRGLNMWDPSTKTMYCEDGNTPTLPLMNSGMIWSIRETSNGHIWFTTAERGVFDFDPATGKYRNFMHDPDDPWSINDNSVWCITEDRSGLLWTGAWQGGVNVFDPRLERFALFRVNPKDSNSIPSNTIWSFCEDDANGVWIGTGMGPVHYDPVTHQFRQPPLNTKSNPDPNAPPANSNIQAICRDGEGSIWMGTAGAGLHRYDPKTNSYKLYYPDQKNENSILSSLVNEVYCDPQGNVWIGCGIGYVQRYNAITDQFDNYPFDPADSVKFGNGPLAITGLGKDRIAIGTFDGDVYELNIPTKKYKLLYRAPSGNNIACLYRDKIGNLWVGTSGSGLAYLAGEKIILFTEKEGLPNNVINGIVPGDDGELWISTNRGICRFDPVRQDVRCYTTQDGLQGNEFNANAYFRTGDGRVWFGGVNGVTAFFPKDILPNKALAPAILTSFTVLNKSRALAENISFTKDITLKYSDYFFSFEFSGLEFTNPGRNQFRYMMEGFDEDWMDAGTRRFVTYTNLDPGEYTFRVRASNNDGVWGGKETEVHITITPPFWKTTWFYILCGIVVVLSIWGYIKWRESALLKEKQVLETKVTERTFELNQEKEKVTAAHKDIRDSINYAKRIQYALLAHETLLDKNLQEYFILFHPKDVVSGDFYWATLRQAQGTPNKNQFYLAACDSTGHGVPGAFMSLLNISFLNEAVIEKKIEKPGEIFDHVRARLIENVSQDGGKDGMDAILVCIDETSHTITYAAAHNAPVIIRNGEIIQLPTDKMPVGKGEKEENFRTMELPVQPGDSVYLYTDGFGDQFGGPQGKKYKENTLRKLLSEIALLPVKEQQEKLDAAFRDWKGELEQIDDVLLIGIKIR
jgi:ligand-binding sensor domain-containing protein/serine phosphatase RsbU (regulator of sigma subunit)